MTIIPGSIQSTRILTLDEWPEDTPADRAIKQDFRKLCDELQEEVERRKHESKLPEC